MARLEGGHGSSSGSTSSVHMIGKMPVKLKMSAQVTTRCGLICVPVGYNSPHYEMTNLTGGGFRATTRATMVTCQKCRNLINGGTIHAK